MRSLNPKSENCTRIGVFGLGLVPGRKPAATINIKVFYGLCRYKVALPSNSNFGYLRSVISDITGLKPGKYRLFFGGLEKEDDEVLQDAGVINNSEVLLVEDRESKPETSEEDRVDSDSEATCADSDSEAKSAVAEVRRDVDTLVEQVLALKAVVDSGNRVDKNQIIYLTEMLMRQLLKLDGIEAEGDARVQRKMEVRRVQSYVEALDYLKTRNSNL